MTNSRKIINSLFFNLILFQIISISIIFRNSQINLTTKSLFPQATLLLLILATLICLLYYISLLRIFINKITLSNKTITILLTLNSIPTITYIILRLIDKFTYPNYVFGNLGIYLPFLQIFTIYLIPSMVFLISKTYKEFFKLSKHSTSADKPNSKTTKLKFSSNILTILIWSILLSIFILQINDFLNWISQESKLTTYYANLPPNLRYEPAIYELHNDVLFISQHVPKDAVIIHPTQSNIFPVIGNQVIIRYYLTSQTLISASKINEYISNNPNQKNVYSIIKIAKNKDQSIYYPDHEIFSEKTTILLNDGRIKEFTNHIITPEWINSIPELKIGITKHQL